MALSLLELLLLSAALLVVVAVLLAVLPVRAAHSRRRVVGGRAAGGGTARYDRSITTFDPSGRLLQVEYGMEASNRGSSVVAALLALSTTKRGEGTDGESDSVDVDDDVTDVEEEEAICLIIERSSSQKVHRLADHLWLATSGLSGDSRALASAVRSYCQKHRTSFGEVPTVHQAARYAAELQHQLTRTGGARPLGCAAVLVGVDPSSSPPPTGSARGLLRIFRTDPGGTSEECRYCAEGKNKEALSVALSKYYDEETNDDGALPVPRDGGYWTKPISSLVRRIVGVAASDSNASERSFVDVWVIRPSRSKRGNMHAICFRNIRRDQAVEILEKHSSLLTKSSD